MMAKSRESIVADLLELEPYHFEQFIADVWEECQGWSTKVTDESRDWGVDIVGEPPGFGSQLTIVQAKRYDPSNKLTSEDIQQYASLRQQYDDATGVTVVTTSSFTKPAEQLAERLDVKCIGGETLAKIIDREGAHDILEWYVAGKPEDWF